MSRTPEPLPIRQSDDGKWEVENVSGNWIKCRTKKDAEILSNAPIVRSKIYETIFPNKALAAELDKTAKILKQYRISDYRFFRAMAKRARGREH